ncbi:MAG: hypothetical protein ABJI96_01940 [Paracoccaceae bacterium]
MMQSPIGRDLFSSSHYGQASGILFETEDEAWAHYLAAGKENNAAPAPHFLPNWYRWQNPDHKSYPTLLEHFVTAGRSRFIDPSPFVDLTQVARNTGAETTIEAYRNLFTESLNGKMGFFANYSEMQSYQEAFLSRLNIELLFDRREQSRPRKKLVWVQIGPDSAFRNWYKVAEARGWDLVLNWYGFDAVDLSIGEFSFAQRGTKFTGVAQALKTYPSLFEQYEQILLLDDDLIFEFDDIDRIFDTAADKNLSLFQAGLTSESHCIWPALKDRKSRGVKPFNTVEIMMPGFSMDFLRQIAHLFDETISGFGLDLAYGVMAHRLGLNAGVIFDVRARHLKPIDTTGGAYYDYMRSNGINPKLELWHLIETYEPSLDIKPT